MSAKTQRRSLYLAPETTYAGTRPADSAYLAIPTIELAELSEDRTVIETQRFSGRTGPTASISGPDGASFSSTHEVLGLSAAVGDGASPPTADWLDLLMRGIGTGTATERDGEGVVSLATTTLTLDTDIYSANELVYLVDSSGVGRWVPITVDNTDGSYTVGWDPGITPTIARGSRQWRDDDGGDTSITFAGVYNIDPDASNGAVFELPGLRIGSASLSVTVEQQARLSLGWQGDGRTELTGGSLPSFSVATNGDPAVTATTPLRRGCVWVNGTEYDTASITVDWGLTIAPRPDTCAANGRANMVQMVATPTVQIQPLYDQALNDLLDSQTQRSVLVQVGVGDQSFALYMNSAQVQTASRTDRSGEVDSSLTFRAVTADATTPRWVMARA